MKPIILTLTVCLLLLGCNKSKQSTTDKPPDDVEATEEFTIQDPFSDTNLVDNIKLFDLDNNPVDLRSFSGKRIFLNFWATWCKPCIIEMPSIERAQKELQQDNFVFFLASDETVGRINRFKATNEFDLEFVRVETPFPDLGILSLPTTLIIDEQGKIALSQIGALEWDDLEVLNRLRNMGGTAGP